ncbi:MAG: UDP-N-acetylmuramate dehydrogenase [Coriobacteriales bacterium]
MNTNALAQLLGDAIAKERLHVNEPMSAHTTFKVGGPVDFFVSVASLDELVAVLEACRAANAPWYVIGCGSDLLIADEGLDGVCICLGEHFADIRIEGTRLIAKAGATNEQVAEAACAAGLSGYEFASGIPGTIGGAAIMNAGAYDGEFAHVCAEVSCLTPDGEVVTVPASKADWHYRHSMMSDEGYIILEATLQLVPWDTFQIRARMDDLAERRNAKQPLELGSAGSTFKRPLGHYAGKLIDDAGMRGHTCGGAQVSTKHCGFVVNMGTARARDVRQVIEDVQNAVFADSGVMLEPEVRMWGFDD